ncbi:predicted protein [Naegleria gruberi]|uniref:Acyl carrier protein n=1 Tax=Naegleria gruberi TaxID=5762 RepID=D2W2F9_NAEGR|nr:uncharacterized protein NAEGRDRAFT_75574 [Naegleria gruberi]EFC36703.1 predicted protein [Naegleria gruberi]|eukprot:XP_002669447.1 predicted protein [Naegleria gruberi strain NEG-M]
MLNRLARASRGIHHQISTPLIINQTRFYSNSPSYPKNVIEQKVIEILTKHDNIKTTPTGTSHLVKDLGLDSLDSAEIIHEVENEFVLEINDDVAFQLQSVPQIVEFVYKETHHH